MELKDHDEKNLSHLSPRRILHGVESIIYIILLFLLSTLFL
ncbi:hypothetical protein Mcup_1092 [Metallosphaera cuprina Ar-4]|uniref:Uncharacterized protein n=1 Tax=Metallosphaera cuprina (strain Ar-4) TaxID=1006006 RepID=F4G2Z9_METCR|nr:hypothetical protein Mcup_1092 [Metallosphaera cuprina Ar-4]